MSNQEKKAGVAEFLGNNDAAPFGIVLLFGAIFGGVVLSSIGYQKIRYGRSWWDDVEETSERIIEENRLNLEAKHAEIQRQIRVWEEYKQANAEMADAIEGCWYAHNYRISSNL